MKKRLLAIALTLATLGAFHGAFAQSDNCKMSDPNCGNCKMSDPSCGN